MKAVILQPSYIPWRGYFNQIKKADVFVFYDDVQYDRHGWRNRNRIKAPGGTRWLTIPVLTKGSVEHGTEIRDIRINWDRDWATKHWRSLQQSYSRAPAFDRCAEQLEVAYSSRPTLLADFTIDLIVSLAAMLGIEDTLFLRSSTLDAPGKGTDRLLTILRKVGADHYISGPSARDYLDEEALERAGITLEYMTYDYPGYEQLYPPWDPQVSVLDLLFMKGPEAWRWIWGDARSDP